MRAQAPVAALFAATIAVSAATAALISVDFDEPSLDRWNYAFNGTPGDRELASAFGNVRDNPFYEDFDNRDGQLAIGFDTIGFIPPGLGPASYRVLSATITIACQCEAVIAFDDTQDPFEAYLPSDDPDRQDDPDPGAPFELFGLGYRNGLSAFSWMEGTPYAFGDPIGVGVRNAFALGFDDAGEPIDVSNSVRERFDPTVWAIGNVPGLAPGETIPPNSDVVFSLDVSDPAVQQYLREAVNIGLLRLSLTSLQDVGIMGAEVPNFFTKENPLVQAGVVVPARLSIDVCTIQADINDDGVVDVDDLVAVVLAWGLCEGCPEDTDCSGAVDVDDLIAVLLSWTS